MKKYRAHFNERLICRAFKIARRNWGDWCCVFGHRGHLRTNPILTEPVLFAKFCHEYSVGRTIRKGMRESFRRELLKSVRFSDAIEDGTGKLITAYEARLRRKYGTRDGNNPVTSVLSKLAAFLRPDRFVAWDRFARRGINVLQDRGMNSRYKDYESYLAMVDEAWQGEQGELIREVARKMNRDEYPLRDQERFQRRVLDVCLMGIGGRKMNWR